jgi:type IV pilus assembly protein PilW
MYCRHDRRLMSMAGSRAAERMRGLTLVELMIAMVIGLIVLAGVAQVFATTRSTYRWSDGLSRIQENGRFALEFLSRDTRMAGYVGCLSKTTPVANHLNTPNDYATDFVLGQHVSGHAYAGTAAAVTDWSPALPANYFVDGEVVPDTDVLVIRRGDEGTHQVLPPYMPTPSAALQVETGTGLNVNDIVIVADCKTADLFQITGPTDPDLTGTVNHNIGAVSQGPGNATQNLSKTYSGDAELFKLITRVYYIGRRNNDPANPPALFRKELRQGVLVSEELVDGIESMQLLYGEDTDNDGAPDLYRKADQVASWGTVKTVRIGLLARTPENVDPETDTRVYAVANTAVGPFNDKRQRRVFTTTLQLRN